MFYFEQNVRHNLCFDKEYSNFTNIWIMKKIVIKLQNLFKIIFKNLIIFNKGLKYINFIYIYNRKYIYICKSLIQGQFFFLLRFLFFLTLILHINYLILWNISFPFLDIIQLTFYFKIALNIFNLFIIDRKDLKEKII